MGVYATQCMRGRVMVVQEIAERSPAVDAVTLAAESTLGQPGHGLQGWEAPGVPQDLGSQPSRTGGGSASW
jgi:hypothetical protein